MKPWSLSLRGCSFCPKRGLRAAGIGLAVWLALPVRLALAEKPAASTRVSKSSNDAPSANVSKLQAWRDAELIASLAPGRTEVIGAGDSMKPVYGENTILVLSKIAFDDLKPGMNVVYTNRRGRLVVHQSIARDASGWRARGINNAQEDPERVTRENLVGVVYASLAYNANIANGQGAKR